MKTLYYLFCFFCLLACGSENGIQIKSLEHYQALHPATIVSPQGTIDSSLDYRIYHQSSDRSYPAQYLSKNQLMFLPDQDIPAGSILDIQEYEMSSEDANPCVITADAAFISARINSEEVLKYAVATRYPADSLPDYYKRSGFIHPLKSLGGSILTADFPEGHVHQHGIFNAWTQTQFRGHPIDFWNQQDQQGTVRHRDILGIQNGPVFSSFTVSLEHVAFIENDTIVALDETWEISIFPRAHDYLVDWTIEQQCSTEDTLILDEYHYGGAAFRGSEYWNLEHGAFDSLVYFTTSEAKNHIEGNHTRPTWVSMYGETGTGTAGIAMMGHPTNFRYPQPVRIHPTMPYFVFTPTPLGSHSISPGEAYRSRYRMVVFDGEPKISELEAAAVSFGKR